MFFWSFLVILAIFKVIFDVFSLFWRFFVIERLNISGTAYFHKTVLSPLESHLSPLSFRRLKKGLPHMCHGRGLRPLQPPISEFERSICPICPICSMCPICPICPICSICQICSICPICSSCSICSICPICPICSILQYRFNLFNFDDNPPETGHYQQL